MFMNYWYAIEHTSKVPSDKPYPIRALGEDLVLWKKQDGTLVAQSDLCAHRGAPLSGGEVIDDCLVCPYDGWVYDDRGKCVSIPGNTEQTTIPEKAQIDTYPCVEKYGFIWVFLGDLPEEERPPLPKLDLDDAKEAHKAGWRATEGDYHWDAGYERVIEEAIDLAPAPFAHRRISGNPVRPQVLEHAADDDLLIASAVVELDPAPPPGLWANLRARHRPKGPSTTGLFFPNVTMLSITLPKGEFTLYAAVVPIDDGHTVSRFINIRNFSTGRRADRASIRRALQIFEEYGPQVLNRRPELVPFDLQAEMEMTSDVVQRAYRRWRNDAHDKGYGIEKHRFMAGTELTTVIPSPSRRENPEFGAAWIMKEAQLRPQRSAALDRTSVPIKPDASAE